MPVYESKLVNLIFGDFLMKKLVLGMVAVGLLASSLYAKKVTTCMSYLVGASSEMTCSGDYSGKTTMETELILNQILLSYIIKGDK